MAHIDSVLLTSDVISDTSLSFSDKLIVDATSIWGYWADISGTVYNRDGKPLVGSPKRGGHLSVTFAVKNLIKGPRSVLVHRFVAYYFFGLRALKCQCVRHMNGSPSDNRIANLVPGTFRENRADIPKSVLSDIGKVNAPKLIERCRKLSDSNIYDMRKLRQETGLSYKKIADIFGVTTMTAYRAVVGQSWSSL